MKREQQQNDLALVDGFSAPFSIKSDEYSCYEQRVDARGLIIPEYLEDLNALHELEKKLTADQFSDYCQELQRQAKVIGPTGRWYSDNLRTLYCATAPQRAAAILRVLSLWTE
jgi:hypothetical protein